MPFAKITKTAVDRAEPGILRDTETTGFCLVVTPAGAKSYAIEYRVRGRASPRRMVLGKHGRLTPDAARKQAKELLGKVAAGDDPAQERHEARAAMPFGELIDRYFAAEGPKRDGSKKKPATIRSDKGRAEHWLRPILGNMPVDEIARQDVVRLRDSVAGDRPAPAGKRGRGSLVKGGAGVAAQCVALVGSIYTFAIDRDWAKENPAKGVRKEPMTPRKRYLTGDEFVQLARALDAESEANPAVVGALTLLLFTGCRKGEITTLRWEWVDLEAGLLRLPDSKTGAKVVLLNQPAVRVLERMPRSGPYVFPGVKSGEAVTSALDKVWGKVRKAAGLPDVRIHDLRHSFASVAAPHANLNVIGGLLGHRNAATTQRYAHLQSEPLRLLNDLVGDKIEEAMRGK